MDVRVDAFNVFNTPNLANPASNFSCSTTGIQTVSDTTTFRAARTYGDQHDQQWRDDTGADRFAELNVRPGAVDVRQ